MRAWRHPNGWWYAVEGRKREALKTRDRDTALQRLHDLKQIRSKPRGNTVAAIVGAYLDDKKEASSYPKMLDAWKALAPHFGHLRPDQIGRDEFRSYRNKRRSCSNGTIRKELGVLQAAIRWSGYRDFKCELPTAPPPRDVFITKAEFERLLNAAQAQHVKTFLMLAWYTAARKEAILSLHWRDVDFKRGCIRFGRGKGNKGRTDIPMAANCLAWLERIRSDAISEYVVEWAGSRIASIRKGFEEASARANLTHITAHDIRRSAARHLVENGERIEVVAQYLGHSNVSVTYSTYARFSPDYLKGAADKL